MIVQHTSVITMDKAYFAAGCFWGVEETFRHVTGVIRTSVGYMGGGPAQPTYREVCSGNTGHAETVKVEYDPKKVTYQELLEAFWDCHDPTQLNRQGRDIGHQYRSIIFYVNEHQKNLANSSKTNLEKSKRFKDPIVTTIEPAGQFFRAEEYHQHYIAKKSYEHGC